MHVGVDNTLGLIHSLKTTAANVHDLTPSHELLHGKELETEKRILKKFGSAFRRFS